MEIKILGKNSSNRTKLLKNIGKATQDEKVGINIEIIEDQEIINKYEVSNTPCLVINDKVISQGKILTDREIKNYIKVLG